MWTGPYKISGGPILTFSKRRKSEDAFGISHEEKITFLSFVLMFAFFDFVVGEK